MKSAEYQLVFEFHESAPADFERIIAIQNKLEEALAIGDVDGNDFGQGRVNIFIITRDPERCFKDAMTIIAEMSPQPSAAGFRHLDENDYKRMWPPGNEMPFLVK